MSVLLYFVCAPFSTIPVTFAAIHVTFAGGCAFLTQCVQSDLDRTIDE